MGYVQQELTILTTFFTSFYTRQWYYFTNDITHHHHHNRFTALFPGPPGQAGARRELLDFMVQGEINRGRHTDHLAGATSSGLTSAQLHLPYFLQAGCPSCRPTNSVKALMATSAFGLGRRC